MTVSQKAMEIAETRFRLGQRDGLRTNVMVARDRIHERKRRHVNLYRDDGGLYIRLGKRGALKTYLKNMPSARVVDFDLVVFHEYE